MTFEVRENMGGNGHEGESLTHRDRRGGLILPAAVRFGFKNGTADGESTGLTYYPLFNNTSNDMDLDTFVSNLEVGTRGCPRPRDGCRELTK